MLPCRRAKSTRMPYRGAKMADASPVQRLLVLSDLHLAPPGDQCVFRAHRPLTALLLNLSAWPHPQHLVLNGDVFDFLQIPGYDALSLPLAPQRMGVLLDALDAEPPHRNVVQALRHFSGQGHRLSVLPGNHDPELNLASVQTVLANRLGSCDVLAPHEGSWYVQVAGHAVHGLHGHHGDAFNAISAATMLEAQAAGAPDVALPPGSRLVCAVINRYRRARHPDGRPRFPFVDLLPSEVAVVLALLLLDPTQASRQVCAALNITVATLWRMVLQATGLASARLAAPEAARPAPVADPTDAFLTELAGDIAGAMTPAELSAPQRMEDDLRGYLAHGAPPDVAKKMLSSGGLARSLLLRALGRALLRGRDGFRPQTADKLAKGVMATWGRQCIAVTGHTHAAKEISLAPGQIYLNTGTWLDLVLPPADASAAAVSAWLARLANDEVPRWQGCPIAVVDPNGARLLHWDGQALRPWAEGLPAMD